MKDKNARNPEKLEEEKPTEKSTEKVKVPEKSPSRDAISRDATITRREYDADDAKMMSINGMPAVKSTRREHPFHASRERNFQPINESFYQPISQPFSTHFQPKNVS